MVCSFFTHNFFCCSASCFYTLHQNSLFECSAVLRRRNWECTPVCVNMVHAALLCNSSLTVFVLLLISQSLSVALSVQEWQHMEDMPTSSSTANDASPNLVRMYRLLAHAHEVLLQHLDSCLQFATCCLSNQG